MVFVKTQAGQEALKDRHGGLSSRQRSAFILFDGKRTLSEVLAATAAMGITQDDVQTMIAQGLLAPAGGASLPPAADQGGGGVTPRWQSRVLVKLPGPHSSATKTPTRWPRP